MHSTRSLTSKPLLPIAEFCRSQSAVMHLFVWTLCPTLCDCMPDKHGKAGQQNNF